MPSYYLVDPTASGQPLIESFSYPSAQPITVQGNLLVRVADGMTLSGSPTTLSTLIAAKSAAIVASSSYSRIVFDGCLDSTTLKLTGTAPVCSGVIAGAGYAQHRILPQGTLVASANLAATPTQCVLMWETFVLVNADPKNGYATRVLAEINPVVLACSATFSASGSAQVLRSGVTASIATADRGTAFQVSFTNLSLDSSLVLGSWALLY